MSPPTCSVGSWARSGARDAAQRAVRAGLRCSPECRDSFSPCFPGPRSFCRGFPCGFGTREAQGDGYRLCSEGHLGSRRVSLSIRGATRDCRRPRQFFSQSSPNAGLDSQLELGVEVGNLYIESLPAPRDLLWAGPLVREVRKRSRRQGGARSARAVAFLRFCTHAPSWRPRITSRSRRRRPRPAAAAVWRRR